MLHEFILETTHLAYFVLLSNCIGWHFYNYAFHFNQRLRPTDSFWEPGIGKNQDAGAASCIKSFLKPPLRMGGNRQGLQKYRVLPQRHLAFLPMPLRGVILKRLMGKFTWVLLEQENSKTISQSVASFFFLGALQGTL